ncbi:MAG: asparagine synthase [Alphaproteobacteria bacterium]|nr:asparagine synthase [Alphaproteobacteria bacterium]
MARIAGTAGTPGADAGALLEAIGAPEAFSATAQAGNVSIAAATGGVWHADERWTVALDGRLYNPEDLPTASNDAARVAAGLERRGLAETLASLNGDFALAICDRHSGALHLARDRFGIKPLYHSAAGRPFAFASRPRSLLAAPGIGNAVRPDYVATVAVGHYRFFDVEPTRSPYADIEQLAPGHCLTRRDGTTVTTAYARFAEQEEFTDPAEAAAEYRELLRDAVARRLAHAKRPAFTLSGGLDSSSVVTTAFRLTGAKPMAVSTVYSDDYFDESKEIRDVIDAGFADWMPVRIDRPDLMALIGDMVAFHDEPVATVTWMTHYLLARAVGAQGYDSLFGGLGGDEQHAGEYDYFFYFFADLRARGETSRLDEEIAAWIRRHDHPVFRKTKEVARAMVAQLTDAAQPGQCRPNLALLDRYAGALDAGYFDMTTIRPVFDRPFRSYLKCHTLNELLRNTMPCCLRASDRNTAHAGLNDFFPFHDVRLLEFALRVPTDWKIRDGITKSFMRAVMDGILPEATRTRVVKTGWNAPAHRWFAEHGFEALMDLVRSRAFAERGIYNQREVERLIHEHRAIVLEGQTRDNHMMFLWQLVNLELWLLSLAPTSRG